MASTEGVNIVITGDSSQAVKAVDDVTKAVNSVRGNSIKITADTSQAQDEVNKLATVTDSINDAHAEITADSSQAVSEANKASDAMENVSDAHTKITADGSQAQDEINKVADAEENIEDAHSEITADGSQAQDEINKVKDLIAEINGKRITFTVTPVINDAQGKLQGIQERFLRLGQEAGNAFASGSDTGVKRVEQSLNGILSLQIGSQISSFFGSIFDGIISAGKKTAEVLSGVINNALSIGGGFEAQITNVKVISGATEQELDMLIQKAREMGATLPITAKDAATAMQLLAQRGTNAKDILSSVAEVANLTISQGIDMGTAADILGSTMTNFNMAVDDANKVTAIFNNACNQSALSMSKLVEAMKYVGPAAGAVNMSLTEAVSAMEAIANAGLTGEMTGTGLALVLSKLAATSQILGVKVKNLDGTMRPLKDIFTELKDAGFSLTDAITAFGQRGSKAALALVRNSESLAQNEERLKQWGSTQAAVDAKAKTFTNTMAALQSAFEELHIEIFEQIKNQSKEAVSGVAELTRTFSAWVGQTKIAEKALNAFLEGLGFRIPSASDFKKLLDEFDVQSFTERVQSLGSTLKEIAESIVSFFNSIKTPLAWLIDNFETFAKISFWGWILGKGLQIPVAIMGIVSSFKALYDVTKGLIGLNWVSLLPLITTPVGAGIAIGGAVTGATMYVASKVQEARHAEYQIKAEAERIRHEVENANKDLQFHVDIDFKTGFEELPESYSKASDELKQNIRETVFFLQEQFRDKVGTALDFVRKKFPEMADEFKGTANEISDDILKKITKSLQGSEKDFEALPEIFRRVTERINAMNMAADEGGIHLLGMFAKFKQFNDEIQKPIQQDERISFLTDIAKGVQTLTTELTAEIERANKLLNSPDGQLVAQVSLTSAQKKLEDFIKTASEKYALPKDLVKESILQRLTDLASKGDDVAQSLSNAFGGAGTALNNFLQNAQEAITYLGASPEKFMPALNTMMKGIQRIDPLTGKVTEQFKKAHNALKQWANVTFDQLANRIQRLRRAVEGGFIDKSALEAEFNRVMPQLKLQVVKDLQPQREQYRSEQDFQAVVASELMSKINDLFGDIGLQLASKAFNGQTGVSIGRSILQEVERGLSGFSGTFKIDGVEQITQSTNQFVQNLSSLVNIPQNISNAVNPFVFRLEQISNSQNTSSTQTSQSMPDFQKFTSSIDSNTSALGQAREAVINLVNSIGNIKNDNSNSAVKDYSDNIALIVKEIQASSQANVNAVNGVVSAVNSVEGAVKAQTAGNTQTQDFSSALSPVITAIQSLSASLTSIQNSAQANVSAVNAVENAVKAQNQEANINIDTNSLTQALISGIAPFISSLEQGNNIYQASASLLSGNVQALGQNINNLNKSAENSISALSQLQTAISSLQGQNNTSDLSLIISALQNISASLGSVQSSAQSNVDAVRGVASAVNAVENAVKMQKQEVTNNFDTSSFAQAVTSAFAPLLAKIDQNSNVYQSSSSVMAREMQGLSSILDALRKSADNSNSAMTQLQMSVKASADAYSATNITSAINPLIGSVQSLANTLNVIQSIQQANSSVLSNMISAVRAIESALKSMNAGNTYDIDINQQGFMIEKKSDADMLARSTVNALRAGIGNGGI